MKSTLPYAQVYPRVMRTPIMVRVPINLKLESQRVAKRHKTSMNQLVQTAIEWYLAHIEKKLSS